MTVKELIEAAPFCDSAEIIVREKGCGLWLQGYRIGKDVDTWKCEYTIEFQETIEKGKPRTVSRRNYKQKPLTSGEIRDVWHSVKLPMKIIKKDVSKLPDTVGSLQVCSFQPRHIPSYHREALTHNEFTLDICAYPEGWVPEKEEPPKQETWEGQMSVDEWLGGDE